MNTMKATLLALALAALPFTINAQGLPDGPGKDLVESQCGSCHGLEQVQAHRDTRDGWEGVVNYMVSRGMAATDEEVKTMTDYLAKNYAPAPKPPAPAKSKANVTAKPAKAKVAKRSVPVKNKVKTAVPAK
jgi:hypothetical protein